MLSPHPDFQSIDPVNVFLLSFFFYRHYKDFLVDTLKPVMPPLYCTHLLTYSPEWTYLPLRTISNQQNYLLISCTLNSCSQSLNSHSAAWNPKCFCSRFTVLLSEITVFVSFLLQVPVLYTFSFSPGDFTFYLIEKLEVVRCKYHLSLSPNLIFLFNCLLLPCRYREVSCPTCSIEDQLFCLCSESHPVSPA